MKNKVIFFRHADVLRVDIKSWLLAPLTFVYFAFIAFGNFLRFEEQFVVSEALLYLFSFFAICCIKTSKQFVHVASVALFILASTTYGALLNGFDQKSFFHAVRLMCMLFSSLALGEAFWHFFKDDILKLFSYLTRAYLLAAGIGFFLFFYFPYSSVLWGALQKVHIHFEGDPHVGRFVSVYFDPNFYSNISFLPLFMSFMLFKERRKTRYLIAFGIFFLSFLFAFSRSGAFAVGLSLFILCLHELKPISSLSFKKKMVYSVLFLGLAMLIIGCFAYESLYYFLQRLISVQGDESSLSRWGTFQYGFSVLKERPILGIGYCYLNKYGQGLFNPSFVDSSLLISLLSFGVFPFFALAAYMAASLVNLKRKIVKGNKGAIVFKTYKYCLVYALTVVFFSSFFINILYYNFWAIPILSLFFYLANVARATSYSAPINPIERK